MRRIVEVYPELSGSVFEVVYCDREESKLKLYVSSNIIRDIVIEKIELIKGVTGYSDVEIIIMPNLGKKDDEEKQKSHFVLNRTGVIIGEVLSNEMSPANFVTARNNEAAVEAIEYVINADGGLSLTIYGLSGVGKTHLLHAAGWRAVYRGMNVAYFRAPYLISVINDAFKNKATFDLETEITSNTHILMIDDFQHFNSKRLQNVRSFLFGVIDSILAKGGKVIVTSDVKPEKETWRYIEERIRQRVSLYGAVCIHPPDEDFVMQFLQFKLSKLGIECDPDACETAAKFEFESVREIEQVVWSIASRNVSRVTKDDMVIILGEITGREGKAPSDVRKIWKLLVKSFLDPMDADRVVKGETLTGSSRRRVNILKKAFAKALKEKGYSLSEIADVFGVTPAAVAKWVRQTGGNDIFEAAYLKAKRLMGEA